MQYNGNKFKRLPKKGFPVSPQRMEAELEEVRPYMERIWRIPYIDDIAKQRELGWIIINEEDEQLREKARTDFTEGNLRLVPPIAKLYMGRGLPLADLIEEGNIGLMRAVDKYDPANGSRFSTYATWWVRQAIARAVLDSGDTIRVPPYVHDVLAKMRPYLNECECDGVEPDENKLREEHGLDLKTLRGMLDAYKRRKVSSSRNGEDEKGCLDINQLKEICFYDGDTAIERTEDAEYFITALEKAFVELRISDRDQRVVMARTGLDNKKPRTLEKVGEEVGVTKERVRQIQNRTLRKLGRHTVIRNLYEVLSI